ncbi:tetratricopeptide repeat protein [Longimicrobium sp.]|uniref:tetratricopeptide repeat protein n=1 Tax=Longimicrobium sp. TaxID=2029185 RepID=UPI003B3B9907
MADLSPELTARIQSLEASYAGNRERYYVALAGAWREAGEPGRAEEILRENIRQHRGGLSPHVLLGRCLADRGAYQEAANELRYVLSIDAQNLIALRTLAEMAAAGGNRAEAEKWYNDLLAVDPMNTEARVALQELARGGADAAVADQPVQVGSGWGGASEPLPSAGGADADGSDEFGMIDLSAPDASAADASGVAAQDDAGEWGDLPFDIPAASDVPQAATPGPSGDFDAFGFGSVDLDAEPAPAAATDRADETDQTGAVDAWLDADARQDLGESAAEDRGALAPLDSEDDLLYAPTAGTDLPFLDLGDDADDTVPAPLPLLDAQPGGFPGFDAPAHDDGFSAFSAPAGGPPPLPAFDADGDDLDHGDHPVDAEVVTETMAELYAAQGLLQQSADTYRELIRQRGEEPGLVRRLAEIEARLHPAAAEAATPDEEEAPDWLASVDAFAMGGAAAGLAAVAMSLDPDPDETAAEPEPPAFEPVDEPAYSDAANVADFVPQEAASADDVSTEPAFSEAAPFGDLSPEPAYAGAGTSYDDAPAAGFVPPPPLEASAGSDDPFADSFAGGFDGLEAPAPEPAYAAAPLVSGDEDRERWEPPTVSETDAVGFDLIVVEEGGDEVAAPPEVVADVSADWAIAAAPLDDDEEAAEEERTAYAAATASTARASSMRAYFSSLLAWTPGQAAASAVAQQEPVAGAPAFDAAPAAAEAWTEPPSIDAAPSAGPDAEPWADATPPAAAEAWTESPSSDATPPTEPTVADEPWAGSDSFDAAPTAAPVAADEPWAEAPAAPTYDDAPAADVVPAEPTIAEDKPWAAAPDAPPRDAAGDIPLFDLDAEPWAEAPRASEPPSIDAFELSDEVAGPAAAEPEEALPWELPAEPSAASASASADTDAGGFSFEDFFSGGGAPEPAETAAAPEPEPAREPEPEMPSSFIPSLAFEPVAPAAPVTPPPAAPAAPAASAPAGGQDEDDEDLESFQAWLQSLKR